MFRSNKHIYAQIIDDERRHTLVSASDKEVAQASAKTERARLVGKALAEKARKRRIAKVVFDRGRFRYLGRVKALAEGAREGGLVF